MSARACILLAAAALLAGGCAAPPVFQGTWYMQAGNDGQSELYVAILNRSNQTVEVKGLVLNSPEGQTDLGWKRTFKTVSLRPGAMLVRKASLFTQGEAEVRWPICHLPIDVVILLEGAEKDTAKVDLSGPMPSALPTGWEGCAPEKP
jgi:hypothetical protein